jgi:hypothetical protein
MVIDFFPTFTDLFLPAALVTASGGGSFLWGRIATSGFHRWKYPLGLKGAFLGGFPQKPLICQRAASPPGSTKFLKD